MPVRNGLAECQLLRGVLSLRRHRLGGESLKPGSRKKAMLIGGYVALQGDPSQNILGRAKKRSDPANLYVKRMGRCDKTMCERVSGPLNAAKLGEVMSTEMEIYVSRVDQRIKKGTTYNERVKHPTIYSEGSTARTDRHSGSDSKSLKT